MTIKPGEDWGELVDPPAGMVVVGDDAALAAHISAGDERPVQVVGGDLAACLGAPAQGSTVRRVPIDVLRVVADGVEHLAVAHVIVRRSWWRGPLHAALNVERVGTWDVAPRAHPNDGRLDVVEVAATMRWRERWEARRRLPTGTHVPHPSITVRRAAEVTWTFDAPRTLWLDGRSLGGVRSVRVSVQPDAAVIHC